MQDATVIGKQCLLPLPPQAISASWLSLGPCSLSAHRYLLSGNESGVGRTACLSGSGRGGDGGGGVRLPSMEFSFSTSTLTYRGTENQSDVLVVAHCSEGDLRQDVVVLGSRECGVQKYDVVLLV